MNDDTDGLFPRALVEPAEPAPRSSKAYPCSPDCTCGRHSRSADNPAGFKRSGTKRCTKCKEIKPLSDYDVHHQGDNGPVLHPQCKPCRRDATRESQRNSTLMKTYGISADDYDELLAAQGGICAICGKSEWQVQYGKLRLLCVDHDHLTGKVRGLLCANCNRAIGLFCDDVEILKKAIDYLQL